MAAPAPVAVKKSEPMLNDTESYFNTAIKNAVAKGDVDKALKLLDEAERTGIDICPFHLYQQCKRQGVITPHSADFATTGASPWRTFFLCFIPGDMSDFFIVLHFFFTKNIHYLNALSEILFLSPVVSGRSGYFFPVISFL